MDGISGEIDFGNTLKKIKQGRKYMENDGIGNRVKNALMNNPLINTQWTIDEISYIYPNLCKATHANISSVIEDTKVNLNGKEVKRRTHPHRNNLTYLQINYNCLCDIYNETEAILHY